MTLTIDVPTELEQRLEEEAKRRGISKDDYVRIVLEEKLKAEKESVSSSSLPYKPRVLAKNVPMKDRSREDEWLAIHQDEYAGQWVALDGDHLLAHGFNLKEVSQAAQDAGVDDALFLRAEPSDAPPYIGM